MFTLLTGGALPSTAFLQEVEDYLSGEEIRPLTDEVHAKAPTASSYSVNVDYYVLQSDAVRLSAIQTAVQAAVNDYVSWRKSKSAEISIRMNSLNEFAMLAPAGFFIQPLRQLLRH